MLYLLKQKIQKHPKCEKMLPPTWLNRQWYSYQPVWINRWTYNFIITSNVLHECIKRVNGRENKIIGSAGPVLLKTTFRPHKISSLWLSTYQQSTVIVITAEFRCYTFSWRWCSNTVTLLKMFHRETRANGCQVNTELKKEWRHKYNKKIKKNTDELAVACSEEQCLLHYIIRASLSRSV